MRSVWPWVMRKQTVYIDLWVNGLFHVEVGMELLGVFGPAKFKGVARFKKSWAPHMGNLHGGAGVPFNYEYSGKDLVLK